MKGAFGEQVGSNATWSGKHCKTVVKHHLYPVDVVIEMKRKEKKRNKEFRKYVRNTLQNSVGC